MRPGGKKTRSQSAGNKPREGKSIPGTGGLEGLSGGGDTVQRGALSGKSIEPHF